MPITSIITHICDLAAPLRMTALRHCLVSGDDQGDRFEVTVQRGGAPESIAGGSVMGYFVREADGATIPVPGSASGSTAAVTLPEACYALSGRFTLTVKVTVGQARHAVAVFEGAVLRSSTDTFIDTGHTIPDINELLSMISQIEAAVNSATSAADAANKAASTATGSANDAKTAKENADKAAKSANDAAAIARKWGNVIATVTMLPSDQAPSVTLTDTDSGKSMAFKLPRGLTGLTPSLSIGEVITGEPGTNVDVWLTGTNEKPVINLRIPKGDVGSIDNLTINGKPVESGNIQITAEDVGARPENWMPSPEDVGALPTGDRPKIISDARAHNLLDNSDFSAPVAQAGIGGNHWNVPYLCDRWRLQKSATATFEQAQSGIALTALSGTADIVQRLSTLTTGQTYTFAAMVSDALCVLTFQAGKQASANWIGFTLLHVPSGVESSYHDVRIRYNSSAAVGKVLQWAALYEGAYTEKTLPPYAPRGYAAQLAECLRYYENNFSDYGPYMFTAVYGNNGAATCRLLFRALKRTAPTVKLYTDNTRATEGLRYVRPREAIATTSSITINGIDRGGASFYSPSMNGAYDIVGYMFAFEAIADL